MNAYAQAKSGMIEADRPSGPQLAPVVSDAG